MFSSYHCRAPNCPRSRKKVPDSKVNPGVLLDLGRFCSCRWSDKRKGAPLLRILSTLPLVQERIGVISGEGEGQRLDLPDILFTPALLQPHVNKRGADEITDLIW